jgi:hypothetical protein
MKPISDFDWIDRDRVLEFQEALEKIDIKYLNH